MRRNALTLLVTLAALTMVAAACGSSSNTAGSGGASTASAPSEAATPTAQETSGTEATPSPTTIAGEAANFVERADAAGKGSIEIEADTDGGVNYFSPTVIQGTPGQTLTIELKNSSDSVPHNFTVEALGINQDLDPGASATVTVKIPSSGTLEFHCEYHASSGMVGEFTTSS
jgi:plastocyanin